MELLQVLGSMNPQRTLWQWSLAVFLKHLPTPTFADSYEGSGVNLHTYHDNLQLDFSIPTWPYPPGRWKSRRSTALKPSYAMKIFDTDEWHWRRIHKLTDIHAQFTFGAQPKGKNA